MHAESEIQMCVCASRLTTMLQSVLHAHKGEPDVRTTKQTVLQSVLNAHARDPDVRACKQKDNNGAKCLACAVRKFECTCVQTE